MFPKNDGSHVTQRHANNDGPRRDYGRAMKNMSPRPGSVEWYKQNLPERFNNTKISIRNALGCTDQKAEIYAANVLRWNEKPLSHMKFDNTKCPGCGTSFVHTDKPFPSWDRK